MPRRYIRRRTPMNVYKKARLVKDRVKMQQSSVIAASSPSTCSGYSLVDRQPLGDVAVVKLA